MSEISSSIQNKHSIRLLRRLLFTIWFLLMLVAGIAGQEKLNLQKPFKKCWVYNPDNSQISIAASDNDNLILFKGRFLISFNPTSKTEIWKTEISGMLEQPIVSDDGYLFFVTTSENDNKEKSFFLNSISLKTGVTKWQKKISEDYKIKAIYKAGIILLNEKLDKVSAVQKADGAKDWEKEITSHVVSLEMPTEQQVNILSEDQLLEVSAKSGQNLRETKVTGQRTSSQNLTNEDLVLGYSTGEIVKIALESGDTLWKFKTGGRVSSLAGFGDDILATSFDNFVYLFSRKSGKLKWKRRVADRINLTPVLYQNYAVTASLGGSSLFVFDMEDGKIVNQIELESDNYFLGEPVLQNNLLILQTYRGIYAFSSLGC